MNEEASVFGLALFAVTTVAASAAQIFVVASPGTTRLMSFDRSTPGTIATDVAISGVGGGEIVMGIDFRPADGVLYSLTLNGTTGRLHTLNASTAAATSLGTLSVPLTGSDFGVDFNPVVDRVRIVGDDGQNLRVDPTTISVTTDTALNGASGFFVGSAYTNNFAGAATTSLDTLNSADTSKIPPTPGRSTSSALLESASSTTPASTSRALATPPTPHSQFRDSRLPRDSTRLISEQAPRVLSEISAATAW